MLTFAAFQTLFWSLHSRWPMAVALQFGDDNSARSLTPLHAMMEASLIALALWTLLTLISRASKARRKRLLGPLRAAIPAAILVAYAGLLLQATFGGAFLALGVGAAFACSVTGVLIGVGRAGHNPDGA